MLTVELPAGILHKASLCWSTFDFYVQEVLWMAQHGVC